LAVRRPDGFIPEHHRHLGIALTQVALFSVLSNPSLSMDEWLSLHPNLLRKVVVPSSLKWEVRDKLDQANITERVLFPRARWLEPVAKTTLQSKSMRATQQPDTMSFALVRSAPRQSAPSAAGRSWSLHALQPYAFTYPVVPSSRPVGMMVSSCEKAGTVILCACANC
jgi:hypothetical protein